jgi:hypothetical protein
MLPVAAMVLITGLSAFLVLFSEDDPRCWAQVPSTNGGLVWESRPVPGGGPAAAGPVRQLCTSDIITPREAVMSMLCWAVGGLLLIGVFRLWPPRTTARVAVPH